MEPICDPLSNLDDGTYEKLRHILLSQKETITHRMRTLFTLRNIATTRSVLILKDALRDPSILLAHEVAYCLGQIQDKTAIPFLIEALEDEYLDTIVRHEAGEALGAIGDPTVLPVLERYKSSPIPEIAETCQVSYDLIVWKLEHNEPLDPIFHSIDPAPGSEHDQSIEQLRSQLLDHQLNTFQRYKALFTLRNLNTSESVAVICSAFGSGSALFHHELAYVLGQIASDESVPTLIQVLQDDTQHEMVRHEAAEALGAIANNNSLPILEKYAKDKHPIIRESCNIALDLHRYYNSNELQYADGLNKSLP